VTQGYGVFFITYSFEKNSLKRVNGIEIIETYKREKSAAMNFVQKYASILSALRSINAEIFFHESGATGALPLFCYLHRKKFVYRIPSDAVVLSKPLSQRYSLNRKIIDIVEAKRADVVIAQSYFQKRILKERFSVDSVVIRNGLLIPNDNCEKQNPPVVLWVGSMSSVKCPYLFLELSKLFPSVRFEMVGGRGDPPQLYDQIKATAMKLPNCVFHGFIPFNKVNDYFKKASIFVNTSIFEGFPNTFVQAWANYVPVVSLNIDPDQIIQNEKLGFHSGTFKQLESDITTLLEDEKLRNTMGKAGRKYVEREHDIREVVKSYISIFEDLLR
jgi:glycosyltransferase involved in cell wall biosynthesis